MSTTCEFRFGFWDVTARADATFQVSDNQPWLGFTFIEAAAGAAATVKYYDHTGALKTVKLADANTAVEYVMYYSEAFSIVPNFETARLVDSENFVGTKASA